MIKRKTLTRKKRKNIKNRIKKGGDKYSKVINLVNSYQLGDQLFTIIYLINIKDYLISNNIKVNYYIHEHHIEQAKEFITFPNIELLVLTGDRPVNTKNVWIGNKNSISNFFKNVQNNKKPFNEFLVSFFSELGTKLGLPTISKFEYTDKDLLTRYKNFKDIYKNNDILIINARPQSGQYNYNSKKGEWDEFIRAVSQKHKVVTTEKLDDIPCTRDDNLTIKDIAAISTSVKYIIGVNTGPLVGCFNSYAFKNVKKWYVFDNYLRYSYDNFYMNIPFNEILLNI